MQYLQQCVGIVHIADNGVNPAALWQDVLASCHDPHLVASTKTELGDT